MPLVAATRRSPDFDMVAIDEIEWSEAQIQARAAWYYYIGGLTQQEIADKLGITRLRVNRIVGQARADGLVHIDIQMPLASCVALEARILERFGLIDVAVVPVVDDDEAQTQVLGEAAAVLLQSKLRDGIRLGVSGGRTLRAAVRRLKATRFFNSSVLSLMGGTTQGSGTNTFEVCTEFARVLGAECHYITAPIFCPSKETRDHMMRHSALAAVMQRARGCDIAFVACGNLEDKSLSTEHNLIMDHKPALDEAGAVGDLLGTFLDADGNVIDHPINSCVMALSPSELKAIPASILVSGGMEKLPIIRAILRGNYVNCLVTDESVAQALLA